MEKEVNFGSVKFSPKLIRTAIDKLSTEGGEGITTKFSNLSVKNKNERWRFDNLEEFLTCIDKQQPEIVLLGLSLKKITTPNLNSS